MSRRREAAAASGLSRPAARRELAAVDGTGRQRVGRRRSTPGGHRTEQKLGDWTVRSGSPDVDVRHHDVVDLLGDELVGQDRSSAIQSEDRLSDRFGGVGWHFFCASQRGPVAFRNVRRRRTVTGDHGQPREYCKHHSVHGVLRVAR